MYLGTMTTLAMYLIAKNINMNITRLANTSASIMVFQVSKFSPMNRGPTCIPCRVKAPINTAVVLSPGIPRDNSGIKAPPVRPLLADSEAITPSGAPVPIFSGCLEKFFSWVYDRTDAALPPTPGRMPMKVPISPERSRFVF